MTLTMWILAGLGLLGIFVCYLTLSVISEGVSHMRALLERQDDRIESLVKHVSGISEELPRVTRLIEDLQLSPAERDRKKMSLRYDRAKPLTIEAFRSLSVGGTLTLIEQMFFLDDLDYDASSFDYSICDFRYDHTEMDGTSPGSVRIYGSLKYSGSTGWDPLTIECTGDEAKAKGACATYRLV